MQSAENGTKGYVYGEEECVLGRKKRDCRVLGDAERAEALERVIWTNVGEGELPECKCQDYDVYSSGCKPISGSL